MDREAWTIVERTDDYALAYWQQIFAVVWLRETTADGALHLRDQVQTFARAHPRGIGLLTIVGPSAPLPTSTARKALAKVLGEGGGFIKCSAILFEGSGFRASAVRSVVTGLTMLARQPYPHRVCDLEEAVEMFATILPPVTGEAIDAKSLEASLQGLRRTVGL